MSDFVVVDIIQLRALNPFCHVPMDFLFFLVARRPYFITSVVFCSKRTFLGAELSAHDHMVALKKGSTMHVERHRAKLYKSRIPIYDKYWQLRRG